MSKGLEALDNLVNHINLLNHINGGERQEAFEPLVNKNKSIIEKELKRLEELEKAFVALSKDDEKAKKLLSLEIEKNRALNEILALYNKWLGNEMSDFEFFTLLNEITNKYDLLK